MKFSRRAFVGGALAAPFISSLPRAARAAGSVLRVIPHADLKNIDPIWTTAYITRNHGYLVWDNLIALNDKLEPTPQMLEGWTISDDGIQYTFTLRDGLRWHDGAEVTAEDAVASLARWSKRDSMGQKLYDFVDKVEAKDKKTFVMTLKSPYGQVLPSIGKVRARPPLRHQVRRSFRYCSPSPSPRAVAPASYHRARVRTALWSGRSIHTAT